MSTDESLTVAACQFLPGADPRRNAAAVRDWTARAAARGAELVVFPEYSSYSVGALSDAVVAHAEPLDGAFVTALASAAREHGIHLVAGMLEALPGGGRVSNTVVALAPDGCTEAVYRKQHLYDAFGVRESRWLSPGSLEAPDVFAVGAFRVGLQTCYDLRFPEVSRTLVDAGATLLLAPADWLPGDHKVEQWRLFTAARAVENAAYVVAADHPRPTGVGISRIVDPRGVASAEGDGTSEQLVVAEISAAVVADARRHNPVLEARRYRVVPA